MQDATKRNKKRSPIISAVIIIVLLGIFLAVMVVPLLGDAEEALLVIGIIGFYGLIIVAVIIGVIFALRQRLKEIEGGEEEDAKQY